LSSQRRCSGGIARDARLFWKYKSRAAAPKPKIAAETVALIKEMARDNRLWGAERIRGELLKLGIYVCKRTIQKYMRHARSPRRGGQKWAAFLQNHAKDMWACDALAGHRPLLSLAGGPSSLSMCTLGESSMWVSLDLLPMPGPHNNCERQPPMDNRRTISFVIVMASLDPVSLAWQQRAASRYSKRPTMRLGPMRFVNGFC
jgi:hypothetical protein